MSVLTVKHLRKKFHKKEVVKDISFHVGTNEVVGLLGPNGAGKTTSFYITLGLIEADNGEIWLDDVELTKLKIHERARKGVGYLPQEASVFRKLTVYENLMAILELNPNLSKKQRKDRVTELFDEFRIGHLSSNLGISLSGGERRRVEIARAVANNPKFILLDEPFAGIDPISILDIKAVIQQLNQQGVGLLITDHNVRETLSVCHRAYIVNDGKVLAEGTLADIFANDEVRDVYLGKNFNL